MKLVAIYTHPENGAEFDQEKAAVLQQGSIYPVTDIEIGGYRTDIFLDGFECSFNSVLFDIYKLNDFDIRELWVERR